MENFQATGNGRPGDTPPPLVTLLTNAASDLNRRDAQLSTRDAQIRTRDRLPPPSDAVDIGADADAEQCSTIEIEGDRRQTAGPDPVFDRTRCQLIDEIVPEPGAHQVDGDPAVGDDNDAAVGQPIVKLQEERREPVSRGT